VNTLVHTQYCAICPVNTLGHTQYCAVLQQSHSYVSRAGRGYFHQGRNSNSQPAPRCNNSRGASHLQPGQEHLLAEMPRPYNWSRGLEPLPTPTGRTLKAHTRKIPTLGAHMQYTTNALCHAVIKPSYCPSWVCRCGRPWCLEATHFGRQKSWALHPPAISRTSARTRPKSARESCALCDSTSSTV